MAKGKMTGTGRGSLLRKSLVVFQFAASLFLLIGTLSVHRQIQFMCKQSLGIDINQMLVIKEPVIKNDSTFLKQMTSFKEPLQQQTAVKSITVSTTIPGQPVAWNADGIKLVGTDESTQKQYRVIDVEFDFIKTKDLFPSQLSGGQQPLVGIARAIAGNPKVIFADEPTGNLHSDQAIEIMELFKQLNVQEKVTIVLVTHSEHNATYGNCISRLKDGLIVK